VEIPLTRLLVTWTTWARIWDASLAVSWRLSNISFDASQYERANQAGRYSHREVDVGANTFDAEVGEGRGEGTLNGGEDRLDVRLDGRSVDAGDGGLGHEHDAARLPVS
jgi:hypothetical protein